MTIRRALVRVGSLLGMADGLRPCRRCGQGLAPDAARCPRCGGLTPRARSARLVVSWLIVAVLTVVGAVYLNHEQGVRADRYARCIAAGGSDATCPQPGGLLDGGG